MNRFSLYFLVSVILLSACVSNKKFLYLQQNDINPTGKQLPKDTVVRSYNNKPYDYRVQTNDLISVRFESISEKEFDFLRSNNQQNNTIGNLNQTNILLLGELVDGNGEIAFPHVGKVRVSGFTIFEIQDLLQHIAEKYLESPIVKVRLLNYRITILGEVMREGNLTFSNNRVSIFEAIGLSGGLTDLADKSNIKLIRQKGDSTRIVYLNLLDENFISSPYYYVHQNDILIVPPLKQRPYRKYFGQNLALVISTVSLLLLAINLSK